MKVLFHRPEAAGPAMAAHESEAGLMTRIRLRFQVMEPPGHIESPHRGLDRRHAP